MTNNYTLPAEWYPTDGIMLSWPHENTDWAYMLNQIEQCYIDLVRAILPYAPILIIGPNVEGIKTSLRKAQIKQTSNPIVLFQVPTNDTWIRDYGIITTFDENGTPVYNDFCFNGWGLKFAADKDNLVNSALFNAAILNSGPYYSRQRFVLEGGSIDSDGAGTILTTSKCLYSPNRNGYKDCETAEFMLREFLGAKRVLWLEHGFLCGDDTDSHVDTLARFASPETILYVKCDDQDDLHYTELSAMEEELRQMCRADGKPYNLVGLPMPYPIYDPDTDDRLPATYANFLIIGDRAVIVPTYGQPDKDAEALKLIGREFPGHEIVGVNATALIARQLKSGERKLVQKCRLAGRGIDDMQFQRVSANIECHITAYEVPGVITHQSVTGKVMGGNVAYGDGFYELAGVAVVFVKETLRVCRVLGTAHHVYEVTESSKAAAVFTFFGE